MSPYTPHRYRSHGYRLVPEALHPQIVSLMQPQHLTPIARHPPRLSTAGGVHHHLRAASIFERVRCRVLLLQMNVILWLGLPHV